MNYIASIIIRYKYIAIFPFAFLEGPIVAFVVGFMVSMGYLSFLPAYGVMILGDVIPDTLYFYFGKWRLIRNFVEKYLNKFKMFRENRAVIDRLWHDHFGKTIFFSKYAYGLSTPFLISCGLYGAKFKKFISWTIPMTMINYATMITLGYYLGKSYTVVASQYIYYAGILVAAAFILFIVIFRKASRYAEKVVLKMEKEEEEIK